MTSMFSQQEQDKIRQLKKEGWTYRQLAKEYNCSLSPLQRVIGTEKPRTKKTCKDFTNEEKQKIIELRQKGLMYTQIALVMDVSPHTIRTFFKNKIST